MCINVREVSQSDPVVCGTCNLKFGHIFQILGSEGLIMILPNIGADMNIPEASLQWVISSYSLTSGCFLLLFGRLADVYGRRRTFLAGAAWVAVCSIGCGFTNTEISLDVMRALQGIGIAAGVPAALGVLAQTFEVGSRLRTFAFATLSCGASLGCGLGFVVASVLTEKTRLVFFSYCQPTCWLLFRH